LVAAAVCPHPPLLVPEIGVGLGEQVDELRRECARAVRSLAHAAPDLTYVVGASVGEAAGSFAPWAPGSGVAHLVVDVPEPLPLSLLVGAHLTRGTRRSFVVVDPSTGPDDCAELGRELAATGDRVALLVMGDGSARHDVKAPGYIDERAPLWDQHVHELFAAGDLAALDTLDPTLGDELLCAGRAAWQVLGGAVGSQQVHANSATLQMPFGVGYHVAHWTLS
jgi:hypothetical protein